MRKKDNSRQPPNAPDLQQILLESPTSQPPHNPYYYEGDIPSRGPPPAYSDLGVQASAVERTSSRPMSNTEYSRFTAEPQRHAPTHVVVQQPTFIRQDHRNDHYHGKVRKYNNEMLLMAIIVALASMYAYSLFNSRNCIMGFVVHKPTPTMEIKISDVRDGQLTTAMSCCILLLLGIVKCAMGHSKSYGCYLFLVGLICFFMSIHTGFLAYLSYYTTCSVKIGELASNSLKTLVASFGNTDLPAPSRGLFGESNVFETMKEDKAGFIIFLISVFNFISYLTLFLSSISLC